jgi:hypothetical protein
MNEPCPGRVRSGPDLLFDCFHLELRLRELRDVELDRVLATLLADRNPASGRRFLSRDSEGAHGSSFRELALLLPRNYRSRRRPARSPVCRLEVVQRLAAVVVAPPQRRMDGDHARHARHDLRKELDVRPASDLAGEPDVPLLHAQVESGIVDPEARAHDILAD